MDSEVRLQVEIKTELLVADLALVGLLASMNKHVTFEFCVVKKSLVAKFERALELNFQRLRITYQFVPMDCHVLF